MGDGLGDISLDVVAVAGGLGVRAAFLFSALTLGYLWLYGSIWYCFTYASWVHVIGYV
jgi:hypothetical protein